MEQLTVELVENPSADQVECVDRSLGAYNRAMAGEPASQRFALLAKDSAGATVGGLIASIYYGWCYVEVLWVREGSRGQGCGGRLLADAEQLARQRGARHVYLFTFSFQAPEFYLKRGYTVFGQLEDYPPPHTKYYLRKPLG